MSTQISPQSFAPVGRAQGTSAGRSMLDSNAAHAVDAAPTPVFSWNPVTDAERVQSVLDDFFASGLDRADAYGPDYVELWIRLRDAAQGGKRFRPALLTGVFRQLGGTDDELAATIAAAIELLHTAFVVHDDVIDHDTVRRGRLNVSGSFAALARTAGANAERAQSLGVAAGILAGDLALTGAQRLVALSCAPPNVRSDLLALLDDAVYVTAAGELSDVSFAVSGTDVKLSAVVQMAAHKTAVYSFELPLQAGAVLAGADRYLVDGLGQVGRCVGTAFQLLDDLAGVFGDPAATGKSAVTDLREGKMTPLIAHARSTDQWPQISDLVGDQALTEDAAAHVRSVLEASGSRAFIEKLASAQLAAARRVVDESELPGNLVDWVQSITGAIVGRAA